MYKDEDVRSQVWVPILFCAIIMYHRGLTENFGATLHWNTIWALTMK